MRVAGRRVWRLVTTIGAAGLPIRIDHEKVADFCRTPGFRDLLVSG
jgi:hypothetical protein